MTPEQQRIAIAEWCGWKQKNKTDLLNLNGSGVFWCKGNKICKELPDYLNDLNAMWEVESNLFPIHVWDHSKPDLWTEYTARLDMICIGHSGGVYRATAAQRAEALLKTIGRWTP